MRNDRMIPTAPPPMLGNCAFAAAAACRPPALRVLFFIPGRLPIRVRSPTGYSLSASLPHFIWTSVYATQQGATIGFSDFYQTLAGLAVDVLTW